MTSWLGMSHSPRGEAVMKTQQLPSIPREQLSPSWGAFRCLTDGGLSRRGSRGQEGIQKEAPKSSPACRVLGAHDIPEQLFAPVWKAAWGLVAPGVS